MNMEMIELIKAMSEVGFLAVCGGLIVLYFIVMNKRQQKFEDRLVESVLGTRYSPEMDKTGENITNRIYDILTRLRKGVSGSRASYIAYHDGTRDLVGSHFDQMSCRVESVLEGISPMQLNFQHIPRSFLIAWCNMVRENKNTVVGWRNIEEVEANDYALFDFLKTRGTVAVLGKAILDSEDNVRGFLLLEYTYTPRKEDWEKAETCLMDKSIKVGEQLIILDEEQRDVENRKELYN